MAFNTMSFITYNCKHYRDSGPKFQFISDIAEMCDFLLLQEHCLYSSEFYKLAKVNNGYGVEAVSSMDENQHRNGRPYGGCAILWNPKIKYEIKGVNCNHNRLCAVVMNDGITKTLVINAYMPCDGSDGFDEYSDVLNIVSVIINDLNPSHIIFGGDFNTDVTRGTRQVRRFQQFVSEHSLCVCINDRRSDVPYTFINYNNCTSKIDHFLISDSLSHGFTCKTIDNHLYSDHIPVLLSLEIDASYNSFSERVYKSKPAWYKATDYELSMYKQRLDKNLCEMSYDSSVLHCKDTMCMCHKEAIEHLYCNIVNACIEASESIPHTSKKCNNTVAGWNDEAEQLKREALAWHKAWKEGGRPHEGDLAEVHRISRARYHRAVRQLKRNSDSVKMKKNGRGYSCK